MGETVVYFPASLIEHLQTQHIPVIGITTEILIQDGLQIIFASLQPRSCFWCVLAILVAFDLANPDPVDLLAHTQHQHIVTVELYSVDCHLLQTQQLIPTIQHIKCIETIVIVQGAGTVLPVEHGLAGLEFTHGLEVVLEEQLKCGAAFEQLLPQAFF